MTDPVPDSAPDPGAGSDVDPVPSPAPFPPQKAEDDALQPSADGADRETASGAKEADPGAD